MSRRYSTEQKEWLAAYIPGHWNTEVAEAYMRRFPGEEMTASMIQAYKKNHKLNSGITGCPSKYSQELRTFIEENSDGHANKDLLDLITKRFGPVMNLKALRAYRKNHNLPSGVDCRFQKGMTPINKGKNWTDFMPPKSAENCRRGQFNKGNKPLNYKPIGSYSHTTDGYLVHKIADPNVWEFVHRRVWENHNGPVPDGYCVSFKDGNKDNCSIDNLMLISLAENAVINRMGLRSTDPDETETGLLVAKIRIKAEERRHDQKTSVSTAYMRRLSPAGSRRPMDGAQ